MPDQAPNASSDSTSPAGISVFGGLLQVWEMLKDAGRWIEDHEADIRAWGRDVKRRGGPDDPWRWLLSRVDAFTSITIMGGLELERRLMEDRSRRGQTLSLLIHDAVADAELLNAVREALSGAPVSRVRGEQLMAGLDFVADGHDHLAVPLLINPLEGIFWSAAADKGVIERNRQNKWVCTEATDRPGASVGGLERALDLLGEDIADDLRAFLKEVVYGGPGDSFRHGTATGGWNLRASFLTLALIGWLETHGLIDADATIRQAFGRAAERQRAAT